MLLGRVSEYGFPFEDPSHVDGPWGHDFCEVRGDKAPHGQKLTLQELLQALYFFGPAYAADMSPVLARHVTKLLAQPMDGGRTFRGQPILGSHKTWRGLASSVFSGILVYEAQTLLYSIGVLRDLAWIDYSLHGWLPGFLMGLGASMGDAFKSFFKRRIGISPGSRWLFFDQLDFFVGAYAFVSLAVAPPLLPILAMIPIVFVCDIAATSVFYRLGLKDSWI